MADKLEELLKKFTEDQPGDALNIPVTLPAWAWYELREKLFKAAWADEAKVNAARTRLDQALSETLNSLMEAKLDEKSPVALALSAVNSLNDGIRDAWTPDDGYELMETIRTEVKASMEEAGFDMDLASSEALMEQVCSMVRKQDSFELDLRGF